METEVTKFFPKKKDYVVKLVCLVLQYRETVSTGRI